MVEDAAAIDGVFHALAHGARRTMLRRLAGGERTVGELAEPLAMSLAAASKHVKVLERAGLVRRTVAGRRHVCRLEAAPLASAADWLRFYEDHWQARMDDLEAVLRAGTDEEGTHRMTPQTTQSIAVRLERVLPAPPARIYRAWLDPALLERWYAATGCTVQRVEVDERPGGRHAVWQTGPDGEAVGGFECTLLELVPDERLVFAFNFVGPDRDPVAEHESRLTIELRPEGAGETRLTLVHERLEAFAAAMPEVAAKVEPGWDQALAKLARAV